MLLMTFLWNYSVTINDTSYSAPLYVMLFLGGIVDNTANVLFMPYMTSFKFKVFTSYMIGEALSELITSLLVLVQSYSTQYDCTKEGKIELVGELAFSTMVYFCICSFICLIGSLSFIGLYVFSKRPGVLMTQQEEDACCFTEKKDRRKLHYLFFLNAVIHFIDLSVSGLLSYSTLPFGSKAYIYATALSCAINPLTSSINFFTKPPSFVVLTLLTLLCVCFGIFIVAVSTRSPEPPMVGTFYGVYVMVSTVMSFTGKL